MMVIIISEVFSIYTLNRDGQDIFSSDKFHTYRNNVLFSFLEIKWHSVMFIAADLIW